MIEINDIWNVVISTTPQGVTGDGFGVPLTLSAHFKFPERARAYTSIDSMIEADFDENDVEVVAARRLFQSGRPQISQFIVGRQKVDTIGATVSSTLATPSLVATITVDEVLVGGFYTLKVGATVLATLAILGQTTSTLATAWAAIINAHADYTATAAANVITVTKVTAGAFSYAVWVKQTDNSGEVLGGDLFTVGGTATYQIDARSELGDRIVAATGIAATEDEADVVDRLETIYGAQAELNSWLTFADLTLGAYKVTADTTRDYFSLAVDARQTITTGTMGRGDLESPGYGFTVAEAAVAALTAIREENDDWFWVLMVESDATKMATVATDYVEGRTHYFFAGVLQPNIFTESESVDTTSIAAVLNAAGIAQTRVFAHLQPEEFPDFAITGAIAGLTPGSYDTVYTTLQFVTVSDLTDTQILNASNKGVMTYIEIAGVAMTFEGTPETKKVVEYSDIVVGNMSVLVDAEVSLFNVNVQNAALRKKVPFTDLGIGLYENALRGVAQRADDAGISVPGSWVITVPKRVNTTSADRQARKLRTITFSYDLQGAIRSGRVTGIANV